MKSSCFVRWYQIRSAGYRIVHDLHHGSRLPYRRRHRQSLHYMDHKCQSLDARETLPTRSLWPWHDYRACRSRLRAVHMPWQPSAGLYITGNESKTGSNLIGRSTSNKLVTDVRLVLGGCLILDPVAINTTQHTPERTSSLRCKPGCNRGRRQTSP